jgi:hypothetical protein
MPAGYASEERADADSGDLRPEPARPAAERDRDRLPAGAGADAALAHHLPAGGAARGQRQQSRLRLRGAEGLHDGRRAGEARPRPRHVLDAAGLGREPVPGAANAKGREALEEHLVAMLDLDEGDTEPLVKLNQSLIENSQRTCAASASPSAPMNCCARRRAARARRTGSRRSAAAPMSGWPSRASRRGSRHRPRALFLHL